MRNLALSFGCLILSSTCLAQTTDWVQEAAASARKAALRHPKRARLIGDADGLVERTERGIL